MKLSPAALALVTLAAALVVPVTAGAVSPQRWSVRTQAEWLEGDGEGVRLVPGAGLETLGQVAEAEEASLAGVVGRVAAPRLQAAGLDGQERRHGWSSGGWKAAAAMPITPGLIDSAIPEGITIRAPRSLIDS